MRSFGFKVVPLEKGSGVPVAVAGRVMVDIQSLLTEMGSMAVRLSLRIQNDLPEALVRKFDLSIGGTSDRGIGSDPGKGNEELLDEILELLCRTLDFLGKGITGTWMEDNFPEPIGMSRIARTMIELTGHIKGYELVYGTGDEQRVFRGADTEKLQRYAGIRTDSLEGAVIGIISKDPVRKNRWTVSNSDEEVPISFNSNISLSDVPAFASAGPVIVAGTVVRKDGAIVEVRNVTGCYSFPEARFQRVITPERDVPLLNPSVAVPSYDRARKLWRLVSDDLGIDVSKPSWDECVQAYHDRFIFLWETYYESDTELEGEELEVREFLTSLAPVV